MGHEHTRRDFLHQAIFVGGGTLVLGACSAGGSGSRNPAQGRFGVALPPIEGATVITDPNLVPKTLRESPDFARQVAAGKLPPVAQRVGQDPLVMKPLHEIGKYGGEIRRGYISVGDFQNAVRFCAGPDSLLYFDSQGKNIVPNIARSYELNGDATVMTLHLRRGMKWSDGHPFTADDIVFWYEDIYLNKEIAGGGELGKLKIEKVDDHTVRYISPDPQPLLPKILAGTTALGGLTNGAKTGQGGFAPKHYLSKFHPKYTSEDRVNKLAKDAGMGDWSQYLLRQFDWTLNPELPLVSPWIMTRGINTSPWTFEANPYSIWVDSAGNQLPYIPKIVMRDAGNQEVLNLRAVAGEYDFQDRSLLVSSLPVLLKNQKRSGYTIHRAPQQVLDFVMRFNLAYQKDKVIGDLVRNVDFRRALSLAVDRRQINQTFYLGTGIPTAMVPSDDSPYFPGAQWRTKWATLDIAQANGLLDKIGLTRKDGAGYRLRPDGRGRIRLEYIAANSFSNFVGMGERVKAHWKAIGIDLTVVNAQQNLLVQKLLTGDFIIQGVAGISEDVFVKREAVVPTTSVQGPMAIPYAKWHLSGGKDGLKPPESMKLLMEMLELCDRGVQASEKERIDIGKKIHMTHADQVWSIGVVGFGLSLYGLYYAKNNLRNVPGRTLNAELMRSAPAMTRPMTFFYK
jgi:peptide/nickel transport system substrate-binding protein